MTKFSSWKYLLIIIAVVVGLIYSLPNLYGETPAIQISSANASSTVDDNTLSTLDQSLKANNIDSIGQTYDGKTLKIKFANTETQLKAKDIISQDLGDSYTVALNLISASPAWLTNLHAYPMFLGLDLRGGVHFLLEVDMNAAVKKNLDKSIIGIKQILRNANLRYGDINIANNTINIYLRDQDSQNSGYNALLSNFKDLNFVKNSDFSISATIQDSQLTKIEEAAVKQNMLTLHNRVNELGVAEPIIQQQGLNRIVVELPGIQDTARAKDILGRTANLEVRLVDDNPTNNTAAINGSVPYGDDYLTSTQDSAGGKILVNKEVLLTGDNINDAQPGFDENGKPAVNISLDSTGASIFKQITHDNIGNRMAMVLVDKASSQVITAPVIRTEIGGGQVQISGAMTVQQANDTALLLRSGALAAPMNIIEERTVGPSLGQENITKGFHSVLWGFLGIALFMCIYYRIFGMISVASLAVNLVLLISILSMLQATLTLPGIAAIALALGMAIDSNVLINERIREELRANVSYHTAIENGYNHAWATILDSNITTLIAGLALLAFGTGPIKGFAVVHCLGILTSLFSAVLVSKGIVSLLYSGKKINKLWI